MNLRISLEAEALTPLSQRDFSATRHPKRLPRALMLRRERRSNALYLPGPDVVNSPIALTTFGCSSPIRGMSTATPACVFVVISSFSASVNVRPVTFSRASIFSPICCARSPSTARQLYNLIDGRLPFFKGQLFGYFAH